MAQAEARHQCEREKRDSKLGTRGKVFRLTVAAGAAALGTAFALFFLIGKKPGIALTGALGTV